MAGYTPDEIRYFRTRFPDSNEPTVKAEAEALAVPGFGEELRRVDAELTYLSYGNQDARTTIEARERLKAEYRNLVVEALKPPAADAEGGALLPVELVERGVQLKVNEGYGKLRLSREPGLTEWYADQILAWYKRGAPEGLWLEDGRLRWGTAITPVWQDREQPGAGTCSHLRLPRI